MLGSARLESITLELGSTRTTNLEIIEDLGREIDVLEQENLKLRHERMRTSDQVRQERHNRCKASVQRGQFVNADVAGGADDRTGIAQKSQDRRRRP